jgi:hypothetical protein
MTNSAGWIVDARPAGAPLLPIEPDISRTLSADGFDADAVGATSSPSSRPAPAPPRRCSIAAAMLRPGVPRAIEVVVAEIPRLSRNDRPPAASANTAACSDPPLEHSANLLVSGAVAALAGLTPQPDWPVTSRANSCSASAPRTRAPRGPRRSSTCRRASSSSGSSNGPDSSSALRWRKLPGSNVARSTRAFRVRRLRGMSKRAEEGSADLLPSGET